MISAVSIDAMWRRATLESAFQAGSAFCEVAYAVERQASRDFYDEPIAFDFGPAREAAARALASCESACRTESRYVDGALRPFLRALIGVVSDVEAKLTQERMTTALAWLRDEDAVAFSLWDVVAERRRSGRAHLSDEIAEACRVADDLHGRYFAELCMALEPAGEVTTYAFLHGYVRTSRFHGSKLGDATIASVARRLCLPVRIKDETETWNVHRSPFACELERRLERIRVEAAPCVELDEKARVLRTDSASLRLSDLQVFIVGEAFRRKPSDEPLKGKKLIAIAKKQSPPRVVRATGLRTAFCRLRKAIRASAVFDRLVEIPDAYDSEGYRIRPKESDVDVRINGGPPVRLSSGELRCEDSEDAYEFLGRLSPRRVFGASTPRESSASFSRDPEVRDAAPRRKAIR